MSIFNTEKADSWQTAKAVPVIHFAGFFFQLPSAAAGWFQVMVERTMIGTGTNCGPSSGACSGLGFLALMELSESTAQHRAPQPCLHMCAKLLQPQISLWAFLMVLCLPPTNTTSFCPANVCHIGVEVGEDTLRVNTQLMGRGTRLGQRCSLYQYMTCHEGGWYGVRETGCCPA